MTDIAATLTRLNSLAAAPKPWIARLYLPNGDVRELRQPRRDMAESYVRRFMDRHPDCLRGTVAFEPESVQ